MIRAISLLFAAILSMPALAQEQKPAAAKTSKTEANPAASPPQQRHRIVVLGIDAADVEIIKPLFAEGLLPNLKELADGGTWGILNSHSPTRSPAVWTTIATGTRKEKHGIYDYVTNSYFWPKEIRTKKKNRTTSDMRKTKAIWEMTTQAKRTSVVVGWLSTWPAQDIQGAMVAPYIDIGNTRQTTIKGSIYRTGAPKQTFDPKLFAELKPMMKNPSAFGKNARKKYYDEPPDDAPIYKLLPILKRYNYTASWSEARMYNVSTATKYLSKKYQPDLVMAYYQCADSFGHRFWHFRYPEEELAQRLELLGLPKQWAPDLKQRYGNTLNNCYKALDQEVGDVISEIKKQGDPVSVVVISDHGFGGYQFNKVNKSVPFDGGHRNEGFILLSGPLFKKEANLKSPWVEDVVPTVLYGLGLQVPEGLDGRVLQEAFVAPVGQ